MGAEGNDIICFFKDPLTLLVGTQFYAVLWSFKKTVESTGLPEWEKALLGAPLPTGHIILGGLRAPLWMLQKHGSSTDLLCTSLSMLGVWLSVGFQTDPSRWTNRE